MSGHIHGCYECYPIVAEWGQYPRYRVESKDGGGVAFPGLRLRIDRRRVCRGTAGRKSAA